MALGMEMLFSSMGLDPEKLQANVNNAIEHVKAIDERMGRLEQAAISLLQSSTVTTQGLARIEAMQTSSLNFAAQTSAVVVRIEDAVDHLRNDAPPSSPEFIEAATRELPNAATEMQSQLEGEIQHDGTSSGNPSNSDNKI